MLNPSLFEINTRVWLAEQGEGFKLVDVPLDYWDFLQTNGIDYLWLMGIWQTSAETTRSFDLDPIRLDSYQKAVGYPVDPKDVIGSPYAIDAYEISPLIGSTDELIQVKKELNKRGIKLILDFVPNHFSRHTRYLNSHPQHFIQYKPHNSQTEKQDHFYHNGLDFVHGKDPVSGSWHDTVQVDYRSNDTRHWMIEQLQKIAKLCDGVRCDMAMLLLNSIIQKTWGDDENILVLEDEFWSIAIPSIRQSNSNFIFIAEVYWDLEWELQQLGFDYTYDKRLLDRLKSQDLQGIHSHLVAGLDYQSKLARFLENHDEERALQAFSMEQSKAAAVITYTLPGLKFFHQGQWIGRMRRIPVQLGRFPREVEWITKKMDDRLPEGLHVLSSDAFDFYSRLTKILQEPALRSGYWEKIEGFPNDKKSIFVWKWTSESSIILIVVNYSSDIEEFAISLISEAKAVVDLWTQMSFSMNKITSTSIMVGLRPYQFRILKLISD